MYEDAECASRAVCAVCVLLAYYPFGCVAYLLVFQVRNRDFFPCLLASKRLFWVRLSRNLLIRIKQFQSKSSKVERIKKDV